MNGINEEAIKKNVKDKDTWLRLVYLLLFGFFFYVMIFIIFVCAAFQFLAKLFGGAPVEFVSEFCDNLATYQAQVTRFLTFASDEKPFPYAAFPSKKISG